MAILHGFLLVFLLSLLLFLWFDCRQYTFGVSCFVHFLPFLCQKWFLGFYIIFHMLMTSHFLLYYCNSTHLMAETIRKTLTRNGFKLGENGKSVHFNAFTQAQTFTHQISTCSIFDETNGFVEIFNFLEHLQLTAIELWIWLHSTQSHINWISNGFYCHKSVGIW